MKRPPVELKAPPLVTGGYVRLPLPPELLAAFAEYADHGRRFYDLLRRADASVLELGTACLDAARVIGRDAPKVRDALAKRKRKK